MLDTRSPYQKMPRMTRWALWIRYIPLTYPMFCWRTIQWFYLSIRYGNNSGLSQLDCLRLIWRAERGYADMKMKNYFTLEQILEKLKCENS